MWFKAKDVERLAGIPQATLRDWRSKAKDFDRDDVDTSKDHLYSPRGLLALGIMKVLRDAGVSLPDAWAIALFAGGEVAKYLEIWEQDFWYHDARTDGALNTTRASWVYFPSGFGQPLATDSLGFLQPRNGQVAQTLYSVFEIAAALSPDLVAAVGGTPVRRAEVTVGV
ncbi:MAG: helix-turn-helix domain-containing protein [Rhodobacteraceae bacterium]|jgi:hypothetical protein|nr:helix-turn-helix domain-containing protein [Paracoccaceae bacterium]